MSEELPKRKTWKPFLLGCLCGIFITLLLIILGILVGSHTLKFQMAKWERSSLKTPRIQTSDIFDFSAIGVDMDGKQVSFNDFKGKPIFILVWHPECIHCLSTLMTVQNLYKSLNNFDVPVLALTEGKLEDIKKVNGELNCTLPMLQVKGTFVKSLCGDNVPCGLVINQQGKIIYRYTGSADWGSEEIANYLITLQQN
ncbi:MAG TPA: TlpA disulfide reductase family protein [Candidatus Hydrogenedens sp.]|nr:TlpA disulfide reductase family protein [Candidatus Hydrogenedens sp.]